MFLKEKVTVEDWESVLSIIEDYGIDYLINVFDKLTKLQQGKYTLNQSIYARYGDQRSSESRLFNNNEKLFSRLTKAKISFYTEGGSMFYHPKKWMPFNYFLMQMRHEILTKEWTIDQYKTVLNELKSLHFDSVSINRDDWQYPQGYELTLPYFLMSDNGATAMRKIYSDADMYIEEKESSSREYSIPDGYPNILWKYHLNGDYTNEASWYLIVEIIKKFQARTQANLYLRSLAIDTSKIPQRDEIESLDFDPSKVYKASSTK